MKKTICICCVVLVSVFLSVGCDNRSPEEVRNEYPLQDTGNGVQFDVSCGCDGYDGVQKIVHSYAECGYKVVSMTRIANEFYIVFERVDNNETK